MQEMEIGQLLLDLDAGDLRGFFRQRGAAKLKDALADLKRDSQEALFSAGRDSSVLPGCMPLWKLAFRLWFASVWKSTGLNLAKTCCAAAGLSEPFGRAGIC